ncbi:hypothetical protein BT93_L2688 [Corymbia citriodora subsp. variegata]|uniref:Late embryogenesis abundant protein LEA-2 subgroup domain-containing protein n=1 Tax=Corymbia citriodora subsp. variegata TaxID=360336 RepID=A0A8T0CNG4_CORYI|nr:hypothetical protein BT93_L2688 [Corymbia citriodora subsp. variegata]
MQQTTSSPPGIQQDTHHGPSRLRRKVIERCLVAAVVSLCFPIIVFLAIPATMSPTFSLDPASSLSSFNVSDSHVTTEWTLVFSIENPSKLIPVKYSHMKATIVLDSAPLAHANFSSFIQKAATHTSVRAHFHSALARANEISIKSLVSGLERGEVRVDAVLSSGRRLGLGAWWVPIFDVSVTCNDLMFTAESNVGGMTLLVGSSYCVLGFFSYV